MAGQDPLGLNNIASKKQAPVSDPLGLNTLVPEKKKTTPVDLSSSGGQSPLPQTDNFANHKQSGPVFPEGYTQAFKPVDVANVKRLLGVQAQVPASVQLPPKMAADAQRMKTDVSQVIKDAPKPVEKPIDGVVNQASKDYANELSKYPEGVQKDAQSLVPQDQPDLQQINNAYNDQHLRPVEEEKFSVISSDKVLGPIINQFDKGVVGGVASVMDFMDGANVALNDAFTAVTGIDIKGETLFKKASKYLHSNDDVWVDDPIFGSKKAASLTKEIGALMPMLATLEVVPELKIAGAILPKFSLYMGTTAGLDTYGKAREAGATPSAALTSSINTAIPATLTGLLFDTFGYKSLELGESVAKMTESPIASAAASVGGNAMGFVATGKMTTEAQGGDYTPEQAEKDALLGIALGAKGLVKGAGHSLALNMMARAQQNFYSVEPYHVPVELRHSILSDPAKGREEAFRLREEAGLMTDEVLKNQKLIAAGAIDALVDHVVVSNIVGKHVSAVKELINEDPTLTPEQKKPLLDHVDKVVNAGDSRYPEAMKIGAAIDKHQKRIDEINGNSQLPAEAKAAQTLPLVEKIAERRQALTDLYKAAPKSAPKPVVPKPVSIKIDSRDAYIKSLADVSALPDKERDTHMALADAQAELWARETGGKAEDWYAHTFGEIQNDAAHVEKIAKANNISTEEAQKLLLKKTGGEDPNGFVEFNKQNKAIITIYEGADKSTRLHEDLGHTYVQRRIMEAVSGTGKGSEVIGKTVDAFNAENPEAHVSVADVLSGKGKAYEAIHEYFTSGWEKWAQGKFSGDAKMPKVFEQFRDWVISTYEKLGGKITPSRQMQKLYEEMVAQKSEAKKLSQNESDSQISKNSQNGTDSQIETKVAPETQPILDKDIYTKNLEDAKKELAADPENKKLQIKVRVRQNVYDAHNPPEVKPKTDDNGKMQAKAPEKVGVENQDNAGAMKKIALVRGSDKVYEVPEEVAASLKHKTFGSDEKAMDYVRMAKEAFLRNNPDNAILKQEAFKSKKNTEDIIKDQIDKNNSDFIEKVLGDLYHTAYRSINGFFDPEYKKIQYFAETARYSSVFGRNTGKFLIDKNKNVLDLEKWNKVAEEAGFKNYGSGQGLFSIHSSMFEKGGMDSQLDLFYMQAGKEKYDQFIKEFEAADIVKGEDVGRPEEAAYAVKNRDAIISLGDASESIASAYQKAKSDGSNPKLVKAVEDAVNDIPDSSSVLKQERTEAQKEANRIKDEERERIHTTPTGSDVSTPHESYAKATASKVGDADKNVWVRNSKDADNSDRVLMIQISNPVINPVREGRVDRYLDKLYATRKGYDRPEDFFEIPLWTAAGAHNLGEKGDMYVVRDMEEAKKFLIAAKYKGVTLSALDVNKAFIKELAAASPNTNFLVGGYVDPQTFKDNKNVTWADRFHDISKLSGVPYKPGYSYNLFADTKTMPRLKMSEGCRNKCAFCSIPKQVIEVPREVIDQQVKDMEKLDAKLVYLDDKTFWEAPNSLYLQEVYKTMKAKNPDFEGFVVQTTTTQLLKMSPEVLRNSGIKYVELGIETFNDNILKALHKPTTEKLSQKATDYLREQKIKLIPNIIVGIRVKDAGGNWIEESLSTYKKTLDYLKKNKDVISHINIYNLSLYDGTEINSDLNTQAAIDRNELVTRKTFHERPQVHEKAFDMFTEFGEKQLDAEPFENRITSEARFEAENGMPLFKKRAEQKKIDDAEREIVRQDIEIRKSDLLRSLGITSENGSTFDNKKTGVVNKVLGLGVQLDQLHREYLAKPATNAAARYMGRLIGAHNVVKRDAVKVLESMVADVQLTSTERDRKEHKIGEMNRALRNSQELYTAVIKLLDPPSTPDFEAFKQMQGPDFQQLKRGEQKNRYADMVLQTHATDALRIKTSLKRLHMVLDPEFYNEPLSREDFIQRLADNGIKVEGKSEEWINEKYKELTDSYEKMMEDVGFDVPELKDLTPQEVDAHNALRAGLDLIHDVSFVNGHIDKETYDKYKGKYTPRLYEKFETPELSEEDNAFLSDKVVADIYNRREEVDAWKYSNVLRDPVYGLAKRYAQVMSNKAIVEYAKEIQAVKHMVNGKSEFKYIGIPDQPGYAKLGRAFGFPNDTWVRKDIAEHFKGIFYTNMLVKNWTKALDIYSGLGARKNLKKFVTVYQLGVRLGNITGNAVFASMQGISLPRFMWNYTNMARTRYFGAGEWGDYKKIYDYLEGKAVIDNKVNLEDMRGRVVKLNSMLSEAEKMGTIDNLKALEKRWLIDTYQMVDTHGKMAAFKSLVDLGLGAEEAAARVADGFQNLNRVGRAYRDASKIPIFGPPFGAFMGDLTRILRTGFAYNPIGMGATIAGLKGLSALAGLLSKETDEERRIREDRRGMPKIPMPDFIGDIPLEYKVGGNVINLARFITPLSVYSGWDTSYDFEKIMAKTLPIYWENINEKDVPDPSMRSAMWLPTNNKDLLLAPILNLKADMDYMGNHITDPSVGFYNKEGVLNEGQKTVNQIRYGVKSYIPYGAFIDDLIRIGASGQDYYGRQRTMVQATLRFLGYNAQVWDDSRYQDLVERKAKKTLMGLDSAIGSYGQEFEEVDPNTDEKYPVVKPGKLTKMLVQPISQKELNDLVARETLKQGSFYTVGDKYYKAISPTETELITKKEMPFRPITKEQYDLKRAELIQKINVYVSEFKSYVEQNPQRFPPKTLEDIMDGLPYKKAIRAKTGTSADTEND